MVCLSAVAQAETTLLGAGASFPAPVYQKWTYTYSKENPGTTVTYQSVGSGAGLNQIKSGTVDFAGSDNPLSLQQQIEGGLVQVPMLTGGVVVIVNLPRVKDGQLYCRRSSRLEECPRFLHGADQCARCRELAHHRRDLCSHPQGCTR